MENDAPQPIPELTIEQKEEIDKLSHEEKEEVDKIILSYAKDRFLKVANIIGKSMFHDRSRFQNLPDVYYAQRVEKFVEDGILEARGNVKYIRFSEVRLAGREE